MRDISYFDYIRNNIFRNQKNLLKLKDPAAPYNYGQNRIDNYHDKTFKNLFSNKKEAVKFINKHLNLKENENKLSADKIEKCNIEFITKQKQQLETDILYRIKKSKIFILIEQQSKVDKLMPRRILDYYVEIMREMEKEKGEETKNERLPIIYPIVLYTGKTKWTAKTELSELQEKIKGIPNNLILSYYLVDINNYTKKQLLEERSSIAKAMLMEKVKNKEELLEVLEGIVKQKLNLAEKQFMVDILTNIVTEEIGSEKAKELKEKITGKVEESMVTENLRNIFRMNYNEGLELGLQKGIKKGIKAGMQKGIKTGMKTGIESGMKDGIKKATHNFVIEMLKNEMDDETIIKLSKINTKELEKIKKEYNTNKK